MKKTMHKRIIGLLIFTFALAIFTPFDVFASEKCDTAKKYFEEHAFDRYGLSIDYDNDTDEYILKMNASATNSKYFKNAGITNPKLKIVKMQFFTQDNAAGKSYEGSSISSILGADSITPGKTIKVSRSKFGGDVKDIFRLYFKPDGFMDPDLKEACGDTADFDMMIEIIVQKGQSMGAQQPYTYQLSGPSRAYQSIDCTNYASKYTTSSFEYNFCHDKEAAINSGSKLYKFDNNHLTYASKYASDTSSGKIELKCDWNVNRATPSIFQEDGKTPNENYYTNKTYIRGEGIFEITGDSYTYHVETGTETDAAKCKVKCEEVVVAEYGSPIASKAGLCFDYKVRVTSRVSCGLEEGPTVPRQPVVCTPLPYCISPSGSAHAQGGPNQAFDQCINKCDGGKYTEKCSNKCYKQVYGTTTKSAKKSSSDSLISYANKVYNTNEADGSCVYAHINGYITWLVGDGTNRVPGTTCDPYWHRMNTWGIAGHNYIYYKTGIPASTVCSDNCYWVAETSGACGDPNYVHYLNHPDVYDKLYHVGTKSPYQKDIEENTKVYENLKKRCEAYATCNTSTAEFTISASYSTKGSTEVKTIEFPFSSKKDTIKYNNEDSTSCTKDNADSTILNSAGCYDCGKATSQKFYQTEWSFPGTWIHNKTGEITYDKSKASNQSWQEQTNRFCLPLNIKNVNQKWYNFYYAKIYGNDSSFSYNNSTYTGNIVCPAGQHLTDISCNYKSSSFGPSDEANINYNINAITNKFGFFEWDIHISCFYAVNDVFPKVSDTDTKCTPTCEDDSTTGGQGEYRIRTIDLENVFPDNDGNKLASSDTTGRTPGFNWNKYSNQDIKDENYKSLPSNYTKWIQAKGYSVYADEYLDYEINLTKELIAKIKRTDKNYTKWEGNVETNSVNNYQSPLFRNGGILSGVSKYPNAQALQCNNIGAHTPGANYSAQCEDFSGEVK